MSTTVTQQSYEMSPHHEASIPNSVTQENEDTIRSQDEKRVEKISDLKPYTRPIMACSLGGVVAGLHDGTIGAVLPRVKEYYHISDSIVSLLFMCSALGFIIGALLNGTLVHKLKQRPVLHSAIAISMISFALISPGFPFGAMAFFIACSGFGCALIDGGCNVYLAYLPYATLMLNLYHATYGVGAMISPLFSTFLLERSITWRGSYIFNAAIGFITLISFIYGFWKTDFEFSQENSDSSSSDNRLTHAQITKAAVFNKMTILGSIYIFFYVGVEATLGGWGYIFLTEERSGNEISMGKVMSGYWAGLAAGRLFLGYFVGLLGEKLMVTVFTLIIMTALFLMVFLSNIALNSTVLIFIGVLLGPIFPTTISITSKVLPRIYHSTSIALIAALGSSGAAIFPFLAGQITSKFGLLAVPVSCLAMTVIMMSIWIFLPSDRPFFGALRLKTL